MRAGVSVAAFAVGVVVATRVVGHPPAGVLWPRRLEAVLVVIAGILIGFLAFWIVVNGYPSSTSADLLIAISDLGGGLETGAIFRLGLRAVFTTALTATWTTFMSDVDDDLTRQRGDAVDQVRLLLIVVGAFAGVAAGGSLLFNGFRSVAPILAPALTLAVAATARGCIRPISFGCGTHAGAPRRRPEGTRASVPPPSLRRCMSSQTLGAGPPAHGHRANDSG